MQHLDLLTPSERAQLDWAIGEYSALHHLIGLTLVDSKSKAALLKECLAFSQDPSRKTIQKHEWLAQFNDDPEGTWIALYTKKMVSSNLASGKSALLKRLLSGKGALIHPPPKSYGYPWYDLVEQPAKYRVNVAFHTGQSLQQSLNQNRIHTAVDPRATRLMEETGITHLSINEESYEITNLSESGYQLVKTSFEMADSPNEEEFDILRNEMVPVVSLDHALWANVVRSYEQKPWFELSYGNWPAWRLYTEQAQMGMIKKDYAERVLSDGPWGTVAPTGRLPLNLASGHLNFEITKGPPTIAQPGLRDITALHIERIWRVTRGLMPESNTAAQVTMASKIQAVEGIRYSQLAWFMVRSQAWRTLEGEGLTRDLTGGAPGI